MTVQKVEFPAVLILARVDRKAGKVLAFTDGKVLQSDADLYNRIAAFRAIEAAGGLAYSMQLVELARADQALEERRAALEYEAGFRDSPDLEPEPDLLGKAYNLAHLAFEGNTERLERLDRALQIARSGAVVALGGGQYNVNGYKVDGRCECADHRFRGVEWCKHRLAVALVTRAEQLQNEAKGAATPKASEGSEETPTQAQDTTSPDLAQVKAIAPSWGGAGVDLEYMDGSRERRLDLDFDKLEAQAKAAGWTPNGKLGRWINPAYDWQGEQERRQAEWTRKLAAYSGEQVAAQRGR